MTAYEKSRPAGGGFPQNLTDASLSPRLPFFKAWEALAIDDAVRLARGCRATNPAQTTTAIIGFLRDVWYQRVNAMLDQAALFIELGRGSDEL